MDLHYYPRARVYTRNICFAGGFPVGLLISIRDFLFLVFSFFFFSLLSRLVQHITRLKIDSYTRIVRVYDTIYY